MNAPLVSIGLPVRNGARVIGPTVRSVLAQHHEDLELLISDNASTDDTERVCRELVAADPRVRYHRQQRNVGLLNNFIWLIGNGRGRYFRWIGDDDRLDPAYLTRCLERFAADERLVLVTTQQTFTGPGGAARSAPYDAGPMGSDDPMCRFAEVLRLLTEDHLLLDPMYGLLRRDVIAAIPRRNMLREDEIFAAKMALAGPWTDVPEVLAHRGWEWHPLTALARRLDVPWWQARVATALQCRELAGYLRTVPLSPAERRRGYQAVARLYARRYQRAAQRGRRKLARLAAAHSAERATAR